MFSFCQVSFLPTHIRVQLRFPDDLNSGITGEWKFSFFLSYHMIGGKVAGNCYTFNDNGTVRQEAPGGPGGLLVLFKRFLRNANECYQLHSKTGTCVMPLFMVHAPGAAPTMTSTIWEKDIGFIVQIAVENRINLPKPHGDCITEHPQLLTSMYPQLKEFKYTKEACYKAKFAPRELPFSSSKSFDMEARKKLKCLDECDQRLYSVINGLVQKVYDTDKKLHYFSFVQSHIMSQQ